MSKLKNPDQNKIDKLVAVHKKHAANRTATKLFTALKSGNKNALAESITLLESTREQDHKMARELLLKCLSVSGKSTRIGITGVPGVGKSTFIESFGQYLISQGKKVAVLAIDPSSEKTGGSILGDKTRMTNLAVNPGAFIRPTASRGSLGGVAQRTRECVFVCEAAGYDVILIETVGVGQSETAVHSMTDFFLLLMLAGAGDELQGIKRGIMEMADGIVINKADGDNIKKANLARAQFQNAIHLFPANENGWIPKVETASAVENRGMDVVWNLIESFSNQTKINGSFEDNRNEQQLYWMHESVKELILNSVYQNKSVQKKLVALTKKLRLKEISSQDAALELVAFYENGKTKI